MGSTLKGIGIDRIGFDATALAYGAELVTCDRHFAKLSGIRYIEKIIA